MKTLMISFVTVMVVMMASNAFAGETGLLSMLDKSEANVVSQIATRMASGKSVIWQSQAGRQIKVASGYPGRKGNVYVREVIVHFEGSSVKLNTKRGNNGFWQMED